MAQQTVLGLWLFLTTVGLDADKPVSYLSDAPLIFYFATDTETLYFAVKTTGVPAWTSVFSAAGAAPNLVLPTVDPEVEGVWWNNAGVVSISEGA